MRCIFVLSLVALAAMLSIAPEGSEAQVRAMDLGDLARESTYIVRARVDDRAVYWTENELGNLIVSDFDIVITDVIKGAPEGSTVQCFGGTVGNVTMDASEEARLAIGEDAVLFLVDSAVAAGRYKVVGAFQGEYEVIAGRIRELQDVSYDRFRADIVRLAR